MQVRPEHSFPTVRSVVVIRGAVLLAWLSTFTVSVATQATSKRHSSFDPLSTSQATQLSGSPGAFGQINVFDSYPTCSRVQLISTASWKVASFEGLSIRVPNGLEVRRNYVSDHGGRGWNARNISVSIDRVMGVSIQPYRRAASRAYRECTTTLGNNLFALIREYGVNGGYSTSVTFPELQLILSISSPRAESLALSRTIVSTARTTPRRVQ
jgi:hypothetical protein